MDDDVSWVAIRQIRCDTLKVRHLSLVSADDNQAVPAGIRIWINQCWMDLPVTSRSLFCGAIVLLLLLVCSCSHSANEPILESQSVYQSVAPTRAHSVRCQHSGAFLVLMLASPSQGHGFHITELDHFKRWYLMLLCCRDKWSCPLGSVWS